MEITEQLQQLAKCSDRTFPVISVYIRTQWLDQSQGAESAAFLARHLRQARALAVEAEAAHQSLARDLARIEHWAATLLSDTPPVTAVSFALFTCSGADVWIEFPSPIPFENEFTIADRIEGQHTDIQPELRDWITQRLEALNAQHEDIVHARVALDKNTHHQQGTDEVRVILSLSGKMLTAKKNATSLYEAANAALQTVERELKEFRDQRRGVVKEPGPRICL
jgi:ribosomal subunit interface protein